MSWLDHCKQDVDAAIIGVTLGWEAHKQDVEDPDWRDNTEFCWKSRVLTLTAAREFILDKAIDVGFRIRDELSRE